MVVRIIVFCLFCSGLFSQDSINVDGDTLWAVPKHRDLGLYLRTDGTSMEDTLGSIGPFSGSLDLIDFVSYWSPFVDEDPGSVFIDGNRGITIMNGDALFSFRDSSGLLGAVVAETLWGDTANDPPMSLGIWTRDTIPYSNMEIIDGFGNTAPITSYEMVPSDGGYNITVPGYPGIWYEGIEMDQRISDFAAIIIEYEAWCNELVPDTVRQWSQEIDGEIEWFEYECRGYKDDYISNIWWLGEGIISRDAVCMVPRMLVIPFGWHFWEWLKERR